MIENVMFQGVYGGIYRDIIPREAVIVIDNVRKVDSSEILQKSLVVRQFDEKIENKLTKGTVFFKASILENKLSGRRVYSPRDFQTLAMLQKAKF